MHFMEIIAVYCENHKKHVNRPCGQNAELEMFQRVVHAVKLVLKGSRKQQWEEYSRCASDVTQFIRAWSHHVVAIQGTRRFSTVRVPLVLKPKRRMCFAT